MHISTNWIPILFFSFNILIKIHTIYLQEICLRHECAVLCCACIVMVVRIHIEIYFVLLLVAMWWWNDSASALPFKLILLAFSTDKINTTIECCVVLLHWSIVDTISHWLIQLNLKIICRKCNQPYESGVNLLNSLVLVAFYICVFDIRDLCHKCFWTGNQQWVCLPPSLHRASKICI